MNREEEKVKLQLALCAGLAVVAAAALCGCPGAGRAGAAFDSAELNANATQIQNIAADAALIFVGTVQSLGEAPPVWSGFALAEQEVTYGVTSVIKGSYSGSTITVAHVLVNGARQARSDGAVGVDPLIFAAGNQLIVMTQAPVGNRAEDISEEYSVIPYSEQNLAALNALLGT